MSTKIHLFTGGKGGTGKTLIALCLATYFLQRGERPLIVDLNVLNPDLSSIIDKLRKGKAKQEDRFDVMCVEGGGLLVTPSPHEFDHYQLPNGTVGFYRDYLNKIFGLPSVQAHNPDVCLIDTGYHIANLAIPSRYSVRDMWVHESDGTPIPNYLEDKQLNIWFLWTLQTLEREYERLAIKKAVYRLRDMEIGKFDPRRNLHHVFNPHNIYPDASFMKRITDFFGKDPLNAMVDNAKKAPAPPMVFSEVMEKIGNAIAEAKNKGPLSPDKYADIVCYSVLKYAGTGEDIRPRDFYPVLRYKHLLNYTSDLVGKEVLSISDLISFLGSAYILFADYLNKSFSYFSN